MKQVHNPIVFTISGVGQLRAIIGTGVGDGVGVGPGVGVGRGTIVIPGVGAGVGVGEGVGDGDGVGVGVGVGTTIIDPVAVGSIGSQILLPPAKQHRTR